MAWHRATLAGMRPPRYDGWPECGWYKRRFVKNGPWVPVRIYLEQHIDDVTGELTQPEVFRAMMIDDDVNPYRIWTFCRAIPEQEYLDLVESHAVMKIMAATHAPIDLAHHPIGPGE